MHGVYLGGNWRLVAALLTLTGTIWAVAILYFDGGTVLQNEIRPIAVRAEVRAAAQ